MNHNITYGIIVSGARLQKIQTAGHNLEETKSLQVCTGNPKFSSVSIHLIPHDVFCDFEDHITVDSRAYEDHYFVVGVDVDDLARLCETENPVTHMEAQLSATKTAVKEFNKISSDLATLFKIKTVKKLKTGLFTVPETCRCEDCNEEIDSSDEEQSNEEVDSSDEEEQSEEVDSSDEE